ncbi:MAG: hypothetical protein AAF322_02250 [Pseudomonadota bacterium]
MLRRLAAAAALTMMLTSCVVATVADTAATVAGAAVDVTVGTVETAVDVVD